MPRNVSVLAETPSSVTLRADPPARTGGLPITEWKVQYTPVKTLSGRGGGIDVGRDELQQQKAMVIKSGEFADGVVVWRGS